MNAIENVSRRSFLKGLVSVGALVLSARYYPELVWAEAFQRIRMRILPPCIPMCLSESIRTEPFTSSLIAQRWARGFALLSR